jgi:hypothetical protein
MLDVLPADKAAAGAAAVMAALGLSPPARLLPRALLLAHHPHADVGGSHENLFVRVLRLFGSVKDLRARASDASAVIVQPDVLFGSVCPLSLSLSLCICSFGCLLSSCSHHAL